MALTRKQMVARKSAKLLADAATRDAMLVYIRSNPGTMPGPVANAIPNVDGPRFRELMDAGLIRSESYEWWTDRYYAV